MVHKEKAGKLLVFKTFPSNNLPVHLYGANPATSVPLSSVQNLNKIEIYTYFPENLSSIRSMDQFEQKRLGYLSFDNYEKSNFQAQELKSVFIDTKALYLKIALNKCYFNKYNMLNQVDLIAINSIGKELGEVSVLSRKGLNLRASTAENQYLSSGLQILFYK